MNFELEEAYRAEIRRLIYSSLKISLNKNETAKITELLEKLNLNGNHDDFPVISALYNNPLSSEITINNTRLELIDADLIRDLSGLNLDSQSLKTIILQEIILLCRINLNAGNKDLEELRMKRDKMNGETALFWDSVHFEFDDINDKIKEGIKLKENDLELVFKIIESYALNCKVVNEKEACSNYYSFNVLFKTLPRSKNDKDKVFSDVIEMQRFYLIKLVCELDFNLKSSLSLNNIDGVINGKNILKFLMNIGLKEEILKIFKIHPSELSARIHLKLLQEGIVQGEYEYDCEKKEKSLKDQSREEHIQHAIQKIDHFSSFKQIMVEASQNSIQRASGMGLQVLRVSTSFETREETLKALKIFIHQSGIEDLNKFLIDLWLIEAVKISNFKDIADYREKFLNGETVTIKGKNYNINEFENKKHFLDSTFVKKLRKESDVKTFTKKIVEHEKRFDTLKTFLIHNKKHFTSYGSNVYIYEENAIKTTAEKLYLKLKLYKNFGSLHCHRIVIDAFKSFKLMLHVRYSAKNRVYDGIGHFGGFAKELNRLQIKDSSGLFSYKSHKEIVDYFNSIMQQNNNDVYEVKYDGKIENVTKETLLKFSEDFNDLFFRGKFMQISNIETVKRKTAIIAANKKFNNICNEEQRGVLKTILVKLDGKMVSECSTENNGAIKKVGTNDSFNPDKFKYDISTIFSLAVPSSDFEQLSAIKENHNKELKDVTTSETFSLFELIQRFGYFGDTGGEISLIKEHDDFKSYAYKYPHEYFAGPIKTVTKILNEVEEMYKLEYKANEERSKKLRLWILGHLFAAAQNEILDGQKTKLTKQSFFDVNGVRTFTETKKPSRHCLNFKKYILENVGTNREGNFDDEQLEYIRTFFGPTITGDDFNKIQEIISRVHLSVTLKNLENSILDSGRLALKEFNVVKRFQDPSTTVYENIDFEDEPHNLSLNSLFRDTRNDQYGDVLPIKKILEIVLSDYSKVTKRDLKLKLPELILDVSVKREIGDFTVYIKCKPEIQKFLIDCLQKYSIDIAANNDDLIIKAKISFTNSYIKNLFNQFLLQHQTNNEESTCKIGFIIFIELAVDALENDIYLKKQKLDSSSETTSSRVYTLEISENYFHI